MVPGHLIVHDLNVLVNVTHTSAFDLLLFVQSPDGVRVALTKTDPLYGYFAGEDYRSTTFDDEADVPVKDGTPPFAGSFRPAEPLTAFDGRDAYGLWRLQVYDAYYANTGCLDSFTLIITAPVPGETIPVPVPAAGGLGVLGLGLIGPARRHFRGRNARRPEIRSGISR